MANGKSVHNPIQIDPAKCVPCNICDFVCPGDIIYKDLTQKIMPEVKYPDECWYCGNCEQSCPYQAITIVFPEEMTNSQTAVETLLGVVVAEEESR